MSEHGFYANAMEYMYGTPGQSHVKFKPWVKTTGTSFS